MKSVKQAPLLGIKCSMRDLIGDVTVQEHAAAIWAK